jgi:hypothetical protein
MWNEIFAAAEARYRREGLTALRRSWHDGPRRGAHRLSRPRYAGPRSS